MKRANLMDRIDLLAQKQHAVESAAIAFAKAQENSMASPYARLSARLELLRSSAALGIALQRYLGGKT